MTEKIEHFLPPLQYFALYDGIPPREEGQDPTVFYYFPETTELNTQYNRVGLFIAFAGYSKSFHCSKVCEYYQTDTNFTCFAEIGADVYMAATFKTESSIYHRLLLKSMEILKSACLILIHSPPCRTSDGEIDPNSFNHLIRYMRGLLDIFKYMPFFESLPPSMDIWLLCEETIVNLISQVPTIQSVAFVHQNKLLHSSMNPDEVLPIYLVFKNNLISDYKDFAPVTKPKNKLFWLIGLIGDTKVLISPSINLRNNSPSFPLLLQYNDFYILIILSEINPETHGDFSQIQEALTLAMPKLQIEVNRIENPSSKESQSAKISSIIEPPKNRFSTSNLHISFESNESIASSSNGLPQVFYSSQQYFARSTSILNIPKYSELTSDSFYNSSLFSTASFFLLSNSTNPDIGNTSSSSIGSTTKSTKSKKNRSLGNISAYRENGYIKYLSANNTTNAFKNPIKNEEMHEYLNSNDNSFVRFAGKTRNGFLFMEKDDDVTIAVDGIPGNLTNATSEFLKFMKDNKL